MHKGASWEKKGHHPVAGGNWKTSNNTHTQIVDIYIYINTYIYIQKLRENEKKKAISGKNIATV